LLARARFLPRETEAMEAASPLDPEMPFTTISASQDSTSLTEESSPENAMPSLYPGGEAKANNACE